MTYLLGYTRLVDRLNHAIGLVVMYGVFVLMGILLWSSISKNAGCSIQLWSFFLPSSAALHGSTRTADGIIGAEPARCSSRAAVRRLGR